MAREGRRPRRPVFLARYPTARGDARPPISHGIPRCAGTRALPFRTACPGALPFPAREGRRPRRPVFRTACPRRAGTRALPFRTACPRRARTRALPVVLPSDVQRGLFFVPANKIAEDLVCMPPQRKHPAHGIFPEDSKPVIVFDTICSRERVPWLANAECHQILRDVWMEARAWLVGRYVVMPDHIHFFAAPGEIEIEYDVWVRYWKRLFSLRHGRKGYGLQRDHWDRRLRSGESYGDKWDYVRHNPVRRGLVATPDDWPYQGEINVLRW